MERGESKRRLARIRCGLVAGVGAVAFVAAGPSVVRADQSNDNSTTTTAAGDAPIVIPITGAVQVNLACPANVNVLGSQSDSGSCAPGDQSNANSSATTAGGDQPGLLGGTLVAPLTAAAQANVSCPVNLNVLSNQRDSGNCAPGSQSNSNNAATHVRGSGAVPGLLGGPLVAPITTGVGLNVTCPTNVNVLSNQRASGDCVDTPPADTPPGDTPPDSPPVGSALSAPPSAGQPTGSTFSAEVVTTEFSQPPGPPVTGALDVGSTPGGFQALGALVLAVLAAAAMAVRRLRQDRQER
jgi:hypothetical protein